MATQLKIDSKTENEKKPKDDLKFDDHFNKSFSEELVIGLCGPIGTDINFVSKCLREILEDDFNYTCVDIKLSDFIKKQFNISSKQKEAGFEYYKELIDKGNDLRNSAGNSILAKLAIHKVAQVRHEKSSDDSPPLHSKRICFLINSIKHREEYELLERVYRDLFYFIGVFSPHSLRVANLINKKVDKYLVEKLIDIDSEQKDLDYGQKVTDTFVKADYFLRVDDSHEQKVKGRLRRFLDLIFGTEIITPTDSESAMYHAFTASNNSACLSRQVGASITDENGKLISVGWNDVPKAGGELYPLRNGDIITQDHRCLNKDGGICFNDFEKNAISNNIAEILIKEGLAKGNKSDIVKIIKDSQIKDLIEFSRSVHAEMHAIIIGSQKSGTLMRGGKLFCTTYPCHNCARHIIAAGIKEVYYIEPYRKSLAIRLHSDAITELEGENDKVKILLYDGVAPDKYNDLFAMKSKNDRKEGGNKRQIRRKDAKPRTKFSLDAIPYLEQMVTRELTSENKFETLLQQI